MRAFMRDRHAGPVLVSGRGRRRHSDGRTRRESWRDKDVNPAYEALPILGVEPSQREWAHIRMEGGMGRAAPVNANVIRGASNCGLQPARGRG